MTFAWKLVGGAVMLMGLQTTRVPASHRPTAPRPQKVRIAMSSHPGNLVYLQLDLANALHYFRDAGIDVEFDFYQGGPKVADVLGSGQAEFSGNSIDHAVQARNSPHPLKMIASFTSLPAVTLVVRRSLRSEIHSVRDLRGHRIGVAAIGSGSHVIAASIFTSVGIPVSGVTFVQVGSGESMSRALKDGVIDAAIATDPVAIHMLVAGDASLLLDLVTFEETQRVFSGGYQFTGLLTRADVIQQQPELVQKMVDVMVRTDRFIASHSATDIAAALVDAEERNSFVLVRSIEHTRPSLSVDGQVTRENVENNIRSERTLGLLPQNLPLNPEDFFDMSFQRKSIARLPER